MHYQNQDQSASFRGYKLSFPESKGGAPIHRGGFSTARGLGGATPTTPALSVGAPLVGALGSAMPTGEGRHEACPYVVIELRKVGSGKRV